MIRYTLNNTKNLSINSAIKLFQEKEDGPCMVFTNMDSVLSFLRVYHGGLYMLNVPTPSSSETFGIIKVTGMCPFTNSQVSRIHYFKVVPLNQ
jgi:hypothetical protein